MCAKIGAQLEVEERFEFGPRNTDKGIELLARWRGDDRSVVCATLSSAGMQMGNQVEGTDAMRWNYEALRGGKGW